MSTHAGMLAVTQLLNDRSVACNHYTAVEYITSVCHCHRLYSLELQALSSWGPQNEVCSGWVGVSCDSKGVVTGL